MSIAPVTAVKAVRRVMRDACGMKASQDSVIGGSDGVRCCSDSTRNLVPLQAICHGRQGSDADIAGARSGSEIVPRRLRALERRRGPHHVMFAQGLAD